MPRRKINLYRPAPTLPAELPATEPIEKAGEAGIVMPASEAKLTPKSPATKSKPAKKAAKAKPSLKTDAAPTTSLESGAAPISKSAFIRAQPSTMPVREVVAAAKAAGIAVSGTYVYNIRGSAVKGKAAARKPTAKKPTPKVKAPTAPTSKAEPISKSDFIRALPLTMPANEVVEKAKAAGIVVSANTVHSVRSKSKAAKVAAKKPAVAIKVAPKAVAKLKAVTKLPAKTTPSSSSDEVAFRKLVLGLGTVRSRQLLDALERGLAALIRG